jgi:hypothetical protein
MHAARHPQPSKEHPIMKSINFHQLQELVTMLNSQLPKHTASEIMSGKYERCYARLQSATEQYVKNPFEPEKIKALGNALNAYQTASQLVAMKLKNMAQQANRRRVKVKFNPAMEEISEKILQCVES